MPDPDLQRFEESGLKRSGDGLKLIMAMHEMRIAMIEIGRLQRLRTRDDGAIETWRRAYIRASDHASQAIDRLWNAHHWPTYAARERSYQWQPDLRPR